MSSFVNSFDPLTFIKTSSTVGVGYLILLMALLAHRISTQSRISFPLGTITSGLTQGVASLVTSSIIPAASSCANVLFTFSRKANGILLSFCAIGRIDSSIYLRARSESRS